MKTRDRRRAYRAARYLKRFAANAWLATPRNARNARNAPPTTPTRMPA